MNWNNIRYNKIVKRVHKYRSTMSTLSDEQLAGQTTLFKQRLQKGESLERLLPEAFAAISEAARRILGLNPFDVQIIGAIALHRGCLAEMATGEGKTLTAVLPLYLNALSGKGAILVTTNNYLATRDYEEMGPVFRFMGLTVAVGCSDHLGTGFTNEDKKKIYASDIVYTTHGSLGFDYLLNNLVTASSQRFLRPFHYIIIDEADSVLLDSAQTPLVISGSPRVQSNLYSLANTFVTLLKEGVEYEVEDKKVWLTEEGVHYAEVFFQIENFYDEKYFEINRHVILALRAHALFEKEKDYTVTQEDGLILLDSGTGRMMPGVKLRGGQHQALEVKEGLKDSGETRSIASITYQNLFLLFPKVAGMSGTIFDNKKELEEVYHVRVVRVPTNKPVIRKDLPDVYFRSEDDKFRAAVEAAVEIHRHGRPVLLVVSTIAETERVSRFLIKNQIPHNVLNANNAFWEASIIKEAGQLNAVTVATAMAGRGTDIRLGDSVDKLGGLAVIGIGRMANTRLERQVRGRAGRQGDPGTSQFFVALTDEVVKRNQVDQVNKVLSGKYRCSDRKVTAIIKKAQNLEEEYAIRSRKQSMDYDKVIKKQRNLIYALRNRLLDGEIIPIQRFFEIADENINEFLLQHKILNAPIVNRYILDNISYHVSAANHDLNYQNKTEVARELKERVHLSFQQQKDRIGNEKGFNSFIQIAMLTAIDESWVEEVDYLQQLQSAVMGRSFAQRDPILEFENDAFDSYHKMEIRIKQRVVQVILLSDVYLDDQENLHIIFR